MSGNTSSTNGNPSVTELVSGIVGDVQNLGMQHFNLFKHEIKEDLRKTTEAASSLAIGIAVVQLGANLLCFMLVYVLSELLHWPMWACFGVVGIVIVAIGAVAVFVGVSKLQKINALSRQATQVLKDDAQWLTNSK